LVGLLANRELTFFKVLTENSVIYMSCLATATDLGAVGGELGHAEELDGGVQQVRVLEVHAVSFK
jgi:hypothetical protein